MINHNKHRFLLKLSDSLEKDRMFFMNVINSAQENINLFAKKQSWEIFTQESFFDEVMIFDSKSLLNSTVVEITNSDPTMDLPEKFSGCLENRILAVLSPELYSKIYPEGNEENSFQKLLEHEIAHRLHVRILIGDEDAMGPIWFYEGFAIYVSDQFKESLSTLSKEEMWEIVNMSKRISYQKYGFFFKYLLQHVSLQEMVKKAGKVGFDQWIYQIIFHSKKNISVNLPSLDKKRPK